ncbi:uncharacterized protein Hap1MRO34_012089 [Clarias gariepinus]|uniref:basement membrane-specific heparan sulfate proteoglycan core protein-like n=1 Tax=Clarias gariepinus TaxID=13013 RepID=UPI00234C1C68|nr:basement membrane-specific heparan sulfate proteoglycan core protein-like [Clarias gariepinus]
MKLHTLHLMILFIRVGQAEVFKAVLSVQPNSTQIFSGERVTFTCSISGGSGKYHWVKDDVTVHSSAENFYTIKVDQSHKYKCYGFKDRGSTPWSNEVTLSVIERPKAVLTLQPDGQIFSGEEVTFICEIPGHADTEWTYSWYKDGVQLSSYSVNRKYSFSAVESSSGKYTCSGRRKNDSQTLETSDAVTLTVSENPKPELTSDLKEPALTGNSVTLYCKLKLQSAGWKFYWMTPTHSTETETKTEHYFIRSVSVSDGGQYRCRAGRGNPVYYTHYSDALWVNVTERLKAVVTIKPENHVFRGERVTLRCEIQGGGNTEWTYSWYKNDYTQNPYRLLQNFSLSSVRNDNGGKYTCRGRRSSDSQRSEISDALKLTVLDPAETVVSVSPLSWLTEGDSVTLSCEVKHSSTGWTFSWYTDVPYRDSQGSLRYRTALLSDSSRGSGGSYTLSPVTLNHTEVYMCRAERGEPVFHTHYSEPQPLWITAESPPVSLIISPNRTQHFTADSLSLSCEEQRDSTGWTVRRYTHSETLFNCSSVSGSTCNISSLSTSHTGVYWCQSESGGRSNSLNITVHNGDVILESPVHPVTEGNPLTLHCLYHNTKISDSGADFYKDGSVLQKQTTGEMTISSVSKSDEGFYHCTHPERGESPKSWVSVREAPMSVLRLISSLVTVSVYLLLSIILAVKCYRARGMFLCVTFLTLFMESQSEDLKVFGPGGALVTNAGKDLILPCFIKPSTSAVDMTVQWRKLDAKNSLVHLYNKHEDRNKDQAQSYRGRTSLFKEELQKGNASLKLSALRVSDEGQYHCLIGDESWEDDTAFYIEVEAQGSHPVITMESYDNSGGINLVCESRGWNPEPDVWWLDREGDILPAEETQTHRETEGFSVKRRITVHDYSSSNKFYCRFLQNRHMMEAEVIINSKVFNAVWKWAVGISVPACITAVGLLITAAVFYKKVLPKSDFEKVMEKIVAPQRRRIEQKLAEMKKSAVDVTLDPDTAHPDLILSADGKEVKEGNKRQNLPDTPQRFTDYPCVLGKQSFSSGRFYYEVQVSGKTWWTLGVARENINRKEKITWGPQNGFWTVELWNGNSYDARAGPDVPLTLREKVEKVGVFVDYEEGLVSFYDVNSRSHIYSFTGQTFTEKLYPVFCPRYEDKPLIISPVCNTE